MDKKIEHVLAGRPKDIGGETILQPLPHKDFRFASPFIVIHHLPARRYEPDSPPERLHPHPHRGFAPVSFLFEGEGYHRDSLGNTGVLKGGEVQWMFAGKGLLHSEGPSEAFLRSGGTYEFVQVWINVPARHKMGEPYYQHATAAEMPPVAAEEGVQLRLASGTFGNVSGPVRSFTPVTSIFGSVKAGKSVHLPTEEGYWTLLYVLEGKVEVNGQEVPAQHLAVCSKEGSHVSITVREDSKLLYLSGEPIDEPVAAKGNIVMNTAEEVDEAERAFKAGEFGQLEG